MNRFKFGYALAAVFAVQFILIGGMLFDRIYTIQTGQEVLLKSRFVDPRDLFRGHYVTLNMDVGSIDTNMEGASELFEEYEYKYVYRKVVYIGLKPGDDGFWVAAAISKDEAKLGDMPKLKGTLRGNLGKGARVRFPFDRYFAPKKRAKELEDFRNKNKLGVVLALDGKGSGVITGVTIEGKKIYDEPLL